MAHRPRIRRAVFHSSLLALLTLTPALAKAQAAESFPPDPPRTPPAAARVVAIQPLGEVDPSWIRAAADRVRETFDVSVIVLAPQPLPASAFYAPRRRYRGEQLVSWLELHRPRSAWKILGVMSRDLSVTKGAYRDWGVMGVAGLAGPAGVISIHRLGGHGAPVSLIARRAGQVAIHEVGHSLGLPHCRSPRCVMNDAEGGIAAVDRSSGKFCERCRRWLGDLVRGE